MINGKPYPTLKAALNIELDSKVVVVDMGAVRFVTKGADVKDVRRGPKTESETAAHY